MCSSGGLFSKERGRFCSVGAGGGGRARIWSTGSGLGGTPSHEFTPDAHLTAPLSCFVWLRLQGSQPKPKWKNRKRKSSGNFEDESEIDESEASTHIAFGTSTGKILLYSLARADVETILEDLSPSVGDRYITCLDWNRKHGLISCSSDSTVREWNISENNVKSRFNLDKNSKNSQSSRTSAIKLFSDQSKSGKQKLMLTAACQLRLWCLETKILLRTMIGHANEVCHLDLIGFPNDNSKFYAVSGSKNDRILSFWSINLSSDELSNGIDANDSEEITINKTKKKNRSKSISSLENETIRSPCCNFLMEDIPRQVSCQTNSSTTSKIRLCAVTRSGVVHYYEHILNGLSSKPVKPSTTLQIAMEEKDGVVKPSPIVCSTITNDSVLLGYSLGFGMSFEHITPNITEKVQVLIRTTKEKQLSKKENAKQLSDSVTKIKHTDSKEPSVVFLSKTHNHADQNDLKRPIGGKQVDVPMESRLANLSLAQSGNKQIADNNLAQLLVQALHSKDSKLLQTVFECKDPEIAFNSLNRLPIQYIPALLDHLTEMLAGKTNQCRSACVWSEALCKSKSSYLLSLASTESSKIRGLHAALTARLPSLPDLLGLRARLTLTLHRSSESSNTPVAQAPLLDYKDMSSDDEMGDDMDEAIMNNPDDNSDSWNEDDDDVDNSSKQSDQEMSEGEDNFSGSD